MTGLEIYMGIASPDQKQTRKIQFVSGQADHKCWIIEQEIEAAEAGGIEGIRIEMPAASYLAHKMNPIELVHLEMFLRIRGAGSSDRSAFKSLEREPHPTGLTRFRSLIGSPKPRALLLGDKHHPAVDGSYMAAFGPWGGSGVTLLSCLSPEEWSDLALANANEENLSILWEALGKPPVVALGRNAQKACAASGVPCGVVPHPQYVRRFLVKQGLTAYGSIIKEVIETQEDRGLWRGNSVSGV